ncbi:hypothetical protein KY290_025791 [Solanum tuberosum]|uniref:Uncharacterized protein n=1 Tax=Solanum tuberosum TaxID=4113 RepID=A0ABQ7UUK2_SOLTU|nr:hypothetical protein KY290_025791 [Solanum tuberosum]
MNPQNLSSNRLKFRESTQEQKVTVKGNVQPDAVSKTGKPTSFWEAGESAQTEAMASTLMQGGSMPLKMRHTL